MTVTVSGTRPVTTTVSGTVRLSGNLKDVPLLCRDQILAPVLGSSLLTHCPISGPQHLDTPFLSHSQQTAGNRICVLAFRWENV